MVVRAGLDGTPRFIHEVQGPGAASPLDGDVVEVTGVVTSLFEDDDTLDAFFLQEEDVDAETPTRIHLRRVSSCSVVASAMPRWQSATRSPSMAWWTSSSA